MIYTVQCLYTYVVEIYCTYATYTYTTNLDIDSGVL